MLDFINEWPQFICLCKKKQKIVLIVNKLILIYFTWLYTFVNYKYHVLLKRNNVCLMPLSTFVTLSHFDEG